MNSSGLVVIVHAARNTVLFTGMLGEWSGVLMELKSIPGTPWHGDCQTTANKMKTTATYCEVYENSVLRAVCQSANLPRRCEDVQQRTPVLAGAVGAATSREHGDESVDGIIITLPHRHVVALLKHSRGTLCLHV
ncbi:hypothetical protein CBL_11429 [Carabus blaptoides fortunei]